MVTLQLRQYLAHVKQEARTNGYITTVAGRRRPIRCVPSQAHSCDAAQSKRMAAEADRKAVNSTIQGSAADLIKLAMCRWVYTPLAKQNEGEQQEYTVVDSNIAS